MMMTIDDDRELTLLVLVLVLVLALVPTTRQDVPQYIGTVPQYVCRHSSLPVLARYDDVKWGPSVWGKRRSDRQTHRRTDRQTDRQTEGSKNGNKAAERLGVEKTMYLPCSTCTLDPAHTRTWACSCSCARVLRASSKGPRC